MKKLIFISLVFYKVFYSFGIWGSERVEQDIALEGDKLVTTATWEAPMASSIEIKLEPLKKVSESCESLERYAMEYLKTGSLQYMNASSVDTRRAPRISIGLPSPIFKILSDDNQYDIVRGDKQKNNKSILPYFYQERASQVVWLATQKFKGIKNNPGIRWTLTGLSEALELTQSELKDFKIGTDGYLLEILGKDIACDLIAGRISLEYEIDSELALHYEDVVPLREFYDKEIFPRVKEVLGEHQGPPVRQALDLGYGIGKAFEHETRNENEKTIKSAINDFSERFFVGDSITPKLDLTKKQPIDSGYGKTLKIILELSGKK